MSFDLRRHYNLPDPVQRTPREWEIDDVLVASRDVLSVRAEQRARSEDMHPLAAQMLDLNVPSIADLAKKLTIAEHGPENVRDWKPDQFFMMHGSTTYGHVSDLLTGLVNGQILERMPRLLSVPMALSRHVELKNFNAGNFGSIELQTAIDTPTKWAGALTPIQDAIPKATASEMALRRTAIRVSFDFWAQQADDLDGFLRTVEALLVACAQNELSAFASLLETPPVMSDGDAFWDSSNTLAAGAAPSETTLNSAASTLSSQLLNGQKADAKIRFVLVPPSLSATANKVIKDTYPDGTVRVLSSSYLGSGYWYCFTSPSNFPVMARGTLRGDGQMGVSLSGGLPKPEEDARNQSLTGVHSFDYALTSRVGAVRVTAS